MKHLERVLSEMLNEPCWHISGGGGSTWPSFVLVMGQKVPRERALRNEHQPQDFRENNGSVELLVWCTWRLELADGRLGSSDGGRSSQEALKVLIGKTVAEVEYQEPTHDLVVKFNNGSILRVFCDHVHPEECSIAENWELTTPSMITIAGPGKEIKFEDLDA